MLDGTTTNESPSLRVGFVGSGWMGHVHARAYVRLRQHYRETPLKPILVAVSDNAANNRLTSAGRHIRIPRCLRDWHDLVSRNDIDVVSVTGPNIIHRELGVVQSIATGQAHGAIVEDALYAAEIIQAVADSARNRDGVTLDE